MNLKNKCLINTGIKCTVYLCIKTGYLEGKGFLTLEISDSTRNPSCSQCYDTLNADENFHHNYEVLVVKQDNGHQR